MHCTQKRLRVTSTLGGFLAVSVSSATSKCQLLPCLQPHFAEKRPLAMAAAPASVPPPGSQVLLVWSCVGCGYSPLPVFTCFCQVCYVIDTHVHIATLLSLLGLTARDLLSGSCVQWFCPCHRLSTQLFLSTRCPLGPQICHFLSGGHWCQVCCCTRLSGLGLVSGQCHMPTMTCVDMHSHTHHRHT